ncbi:MAG: hypothetical protein V4490_00080 [Pseudomonadota bacterium]
MKVLDRSVYVQIIGGGFKTNAVAFAWGVAGEMVYDTAAEWRRKKKEEEEQQKKKESEKNGQAGGNQGS